ncbi:hypothetical protein SCHPADRAFT_685495 [Schizopora paradoxa]|uniref:hAT-like transposase RNase-H fold domain-containing protein n=1 Tax=Schizopora paradoxa TaxID=27342 RepID=A0A0H2R445_9AGAM|nr:hypothetical protein SCHPADRAFT_685495 [Schizopora paradoxa]
METWKKMAADPKYLALKPAINAGVAHLEKYYDKALKSTAQIVALYLNPFSKDVYFEEYWTPEGIDYATATMEKVFDEYQKHPDTSTASADSGSTSTADASESHLSSEKNSKHSCGDDRILKAAQLRRKREALRIKDPRDELIRYLKDDLADHSRYACTLDWWRVCFP